MGAGASTQRWTKDEVLAIIGPSGEDKTTLLNTLNLQKGAGVPTGRILVNGEPLTVGTRMKACIYVPRDDILWPTLTAREHLDFAFKLYQPSLAATART